MIRRTIESAATALSSAGMHLSIGLLGNWAISISVSGNPISHFFDLKKLTYYIETIAWPPSQWPMASCA
jgi:hypothetical protein